MQTTLTMNITGRLMLMLSRQGVTCGRCLRLFGDAVSAAVIQQIREHGDDSPAAVDSIIDEQLAILETTVQRRLAERSAEAAETAGEQPVDDGVCEMPQDRDTEPGAGEHRQRQARPSSGYIPPVRSMEEKLKDGREPIQKLLLEDCVAAGLVDGTKAQQLVSGMTGKTCEVAEREIVEHLRQVLQDQVRGLIRKTKNGPWSSPMAQADLQQDIHRAGSVRGVLTLCRQIIKEQRTWEEENGRGGILGLFAARH